MPKHLDDTTIHDPLQGRSIPRPAHVTVKRGDRVDQVTTGTPVRALLPTEVNGALVVAGLIGQKPVSLMTPLFADAVLSPLTTAHWEGRRIYARSAGIAILEAGRRLWPEVIIQFGPSRGRTQVIELHGNLPAGIEEMASKLSAEVKNVAAEDIQVRRETWLIDEAIELFESRNWHNAARVLRTRRDNSVPLAVCGETYTLSMGPMLPSTRELEGIKLTPAGDHLLLDLGHRDARNGKNGKNGNGAAKAAETSEDAMPRAHRDWLAAMKLKSVGDFGELCINGQVGQLIRVSEGFQEKWIGKVADTIAAKRDQIRIIAVAGPSSSGKTTFIRRLNVQLQINGLNPVGLSLDDYYVDREKTPKDKNGDYDFETIKALDLKLLQQHMQGLLEGKAVKVARFDFKAGQSHPDGGPVIQLQKGDVLMVEGIHGLNPRLLEGLKARDLAFRIFIHPATTLAFDRLARVSATDLRLLRRIVRDRHQRGYSAADNIMRWPSVQDGEQKHIFPYQSEADAVFDSSLIYEPAVLKVYAERYLLEVKQDHPAFATAHRLRLLIDQFVSIYPDHVPPVSLLREFIGGSGFEY